MPEISTNFAVSTVATAPSPATSGTSLVVAAGHGTRFPDPAVANFNCVVCPAAQQPTPDNAEIVRVTAKSTDTFTITRQQESTAARSIVVGDRIFAGITTGKFYDRADVDALVAIINSSKATVTSLGAVAGAYRPVIIEPPVQRVSAAGALTRGMVNHATAPLAFAASGAANALIYIIPILASDMNASGFTTKLKTKVTVGTDDTAPGINFQVALHAITASAGAADSQNYTINSTAVTSSTATLTTPALDTITTAVSSAFDLPADGHYVLAFSTSGTMATNARATIHGSLWMAHV